MYKPGFMIMMILVATLASVGQMTNTIYVPAMLKIATATGLEVSRIQSLMAAFLVPYGISQFFYGPISDRFGRRPVILVGLFIYVIGAILTVLAHTFSTLFIGTVIQGIGIGVGGVMARTVMRDLYHGKRLHTASSYMSVALIFAPLIAPIIGGGLTTLFNWRAIFIFLLSLGVAVFAMQYYLFPETNSHIDTAPLKIKSFFNRYRNILKNKRFLGNMLILTINFAGVAVFEASSGVLFTSVLHYSPAKTSVLFILPLPAYLLGSFVAAKLNDRFSLNDLMVIAIIIMSLSSVMMFGLALLHTISLLDILLPVSGFLFGTGIVFPTATTGALDPFPKAAGTAGAILGGMQNIGAGGVTIISAMMTQSTARPLSFLLVLISFCILTLYYLWVRGEPDAPMSDVSDII